MAFPTVVNVGTIASGLSDVTPALPTSWAQDDIFVLISCTANEVYATNPPTGWTAASNAPTGFGTAGAAAAVRLFVWWRRATSSETAPTLVDPGSYQVARMIAVRGCITSGDPWNTSATSNQTSANTSISWDSITTTIPQCMIVGVVGGDRDASSTADVGSVSNASLASITDRMENWVTSGAGGGIYMFTGTDADTGAIGNSTATITSQVYSKWIGALKSADPVWTLNLTDNVTTSETSDKNISAAISETATTSEEILKTLPAFLITETVTTSQPQFDVVRELTPLNINETVTTSEPSMVRDHQAVAAWSPTLRNTKGSALTIAEFDANLNHLNDYKLERVTTSITSNATLTPASINKLYVVTALAANTTISAPSGTPQDGWTLVFQIKDDGTSRTLSWNASYRAIGVTLPTATVVSVPLYVGCIYNSADAKWDVLTVATIN